MDLHVPPKKLPRKLLKNLDIIKAIIYEKQKWMDQNNTKKEPGISRIANILSMKVDRIYGNLSQPIIQRDKIKEKIKKVYNYRQNMFKISRLKRHRTNVSKKMELYEQFMSQFLDVSRKRYLPKRKKQELQIEKKRLMLTEDLDVSNELNVVYDDENDLDYEPPGKQFKMAKKKTDLSEIIEAQYRFTGSDRMTTAIVNATLRTFKIPVVVDKSKLRRSQEQQFSEIGQETFTFGGGIYYDSRKDLSLTQTKKLVENGKHKFYRKVEREEHFSIVSQPEGLFLGYVPVKNGTAELGSEAIISFLKNENHLDDLTVVGCDGTNTNVGGGGGINYFIEKELKRPLHWFVCMLHMNELPLKRLISKLDGPTSSKDGFSGPIGRELSNVCSSEVVKYKRFKHATELPQLPEDTYSKLSNDQKYLYRIVNALISGYFPESLKEMKIGALNHSRWVTTASRICKLYALTKNPSETLQILTSYIVEIYAPTWFQIKVHDLAVNGPKNLYFLINRSNSIENENVKIIVQESIQRNAFFGHSENLLLAQLSSKKRSERFNAVHKILGIRKRTTSGGIRRFEVPKINFNARKWTDIIADESNSTEPPFTVNMTTKELRAVIQQPLDVPKYKCHTQMVERGVKEVTRVSLKAIDIRKRNSMIRKTLIHRAKYPKLDSVKDHLIIQNKESFLPKI